MEKIIQINYQGRNISFEEKAFQIFQQYESDLKAYFLKEEGGDETFADLQYRMGEIFEEKLKGGAISINQQDIDELIATIGKPADLDPDREESKPKADPPPIIKKQLFRNKFKGEKIIGGVCSGIANYFSIDPIAVRLVFIVFTIFNVATLFKFNLGIVAYIILWIALKPAYLKQNTTNKLFRNPKDKVLGGVCSGLAQFFNTDSWIMRSIFLIPFLLGVVSDHNDWHKIHFLGTSFYSLTFITYCVLWVIVPLAKNSTDYMLLKGEPINISTIQHSISMQNITDASKSGLNTFLKVVAYILIIVFMISILPVLGSIIMASLLSYNLADVILFTSYNKTLALFTVLFLGILPFVGLILWGVRKLAGFNSPNKSLRVIFIALHTLGWVCGFLLIAIIGSDNKPYQPIAEHIQIQGNFDTLFVKPLETELEYTGNAFYEINPFGSIIEKTPGQNHIHGVWVKYKNTDEPNFSMDIEKSAFGKNRFYATEHANATFFDYKIQENNVLLASIIKLNNKNPYHFQNVKVTIYIPKGKTVVVSEQLKKQLKHTFRANHKNFFFNFDSDHDVKEDKVITNHETNVDIDVNPPQEDDDKQVEAQEILQKKEEIQEAAKEMEDKVLEAKRELEDARIKAERKIEEAKKELENSIKDTLNNQ